MNLEALKDLFGISLSIGIKHLNYYVMKKFITNSQDNYRRSFRLKNLLLLLPTYDILFKRKVFGIESSKCRDV